MQNKISKGSQVIEIWPHTQASYVALGKSLNFCLSQFTQLSHESDEVTRSCQRTRQVAEQDWKLDLSDSTLKKKNWIK